MSQGLLRDKVLQLCGITKNQFYHKTSNKKRGRKPTRKTKRKTKTGTEELANKAVIKHITDHLKEPLNTEGYKRMTGVLQLAGFYINHKKVYRLMKSNQLLHAPKERETKRYVKYRILSPEGPLRLMEIDIKYAWVDGLSKHAYILTIINVFTREALYWKAGWHIKQKEVQQGWQSVIEKHLEVNGIHGWKLDIEVRSDNGPQFCAKKLKTFLEENYLIQTFTHPYTPQENGHIESFHSILGNYLSSNYYENLEELNEELIIFYNHYNKNRVHGSTLNIPPEIFWEQWKLGNIERIVLDENLRKVKFKLKIARQNILQ